MILLLDNYDSFTYNLVHSIDPELEIKVIRNDELRPEEATKYNPEYLVISPGPGKPSDAGFTEDYIQYFKDQIPILGICLGHQAICEVFNSEIIHAKSIKHGIKDQITILEDPIFQGLTDRIEVGRYHSLAVNPDNISPDLKIIALADDGEIMGVKHKDYPIWGLQFHPESIMTPEGKLMLKNFLEEGKNDHTSN